jgi:hypothetical protein
MVTKQRPARQTEAQRVAAAASRQAFAKRTVRTTAREAAQRAFSEGRSTFTVVFNSADTEFNDKWVRRGTGVVAGTTRKMTTAALRCALSSDYDRGYRDAYQVGFAAGECSEYTTSGETGGAATGGEYAEGYLMGYVFGYRDGGGEATSAVANSDGDTEWQPWQGIPSGEAGVFSKQLPGRCQWRRPAMTVSGMYVDKKGTYTVWGSATVTS